MYKLKNNLDQIIDIAYNGEDTETLWAYKKYFIALEDEVRRSMHAKYKIKEKKIIVYNLHRSDAAIAATCIHELAHHIDATNRGVTDHGKNFYRIYQKLLYAALDFGLFDKWEFIRANADASDSNKVQEMIKHYSPKPIKSDENKIEFIVKNCYNIKDELKERGYHFVGTDKTWRIEVAEDNADSEKVFLEKHSATFDIDNSKKLHIKKDSCCIIAGKGSYDLKDILKNDGFKFHAEDKSWRKNGTIEEYRYYSTTHPSVKWDIR